MQFRSRDDRYREAASLLAEHGFRTERTPPEILERYLPWPFPAPDHCLVRALGRCGEARAELFEYEYSRGVYGASSSGEQLLVALSHPGLHGGARLCPAERVGARILRRLRRRPGDLSLYYEISASSEEAARRAIPEALKALLLERRPEATLDLRPGILFFSLAGAHFSADAVEPALALMPELLSAALSPRAHPLR